ncbi:MAG: hypothetical protein AB7Q17_04595 [Phycisphaerae bacterium]
MLDVAPLTRNVPNPIGWYDRIVATSGDRGGVPERRIHDAVEFSDRVPLAGERPLRHGLVERLRGEIARGVYLTDSRIDGTVDALQSVFGSRR